MMHLSDENRGDATTAKKISGCPTDSMFDRYNIQDQRDLAEALKKRAAYEAALPKEAAKAGGTVISIRLPEATRRSPGRRGAGK